MVSLKLVISTEKSKVLYAEAGKEFVDFLFNILALPVGTFIPLLNQEMEGSLGNIYDSIQNISPTYLKPNVKDSLLTPKVYISGDTGGLLQLPNVIKSTHRKLYGCSSSCFSMSDDSETICWIHRRFTDSVLKYRGTPSSNNPYFSRGQTDGGYVEELVTYMVMDDLAVKPLSSTASIINLLDKFNVKNMGALEEKVVELGMDEGVKLLQTSLLSKSVLTDVFLLPMLELETEKSRH
ncbi:uncharacterized protein LOC115957766 [Quercus lobata]|uniref:Uncharacterized protein n=1 Tax=Quercus lobata TaxID=97700 RepID=A0A7N2MEI1_QUELO|nr:uncharacterized protein LOC115957766 [Quercus lobata]